jgi:hypothetical protein
MIGAFWGLLKWTVTDKLKAIAGDISELKKDRREDSGRINHIDNRLGKVEEWRSNVQEFGNIFGRRKFDKCPSPDCPYEEGK